MPNKRGLVTGAIAALFMGGVALFMHSVAGAKSTTSPSKDSQDAITDAQTTRIAPNERPEQKKTAHDLSDIFAAGKASPSSAALVDQPEQGGMTGFDFYRDPLGAKKPGTTFEEIFKAAVADKPTVLARQRKLLESRCNLEPRLDPTATMSRGSSTTQSTASSR